MLKAVDIYAFALDVYGKEVEQRITQMRHGASRDKALDVDRYLKICDEIRDHHKKHHEKEEKSG